MLKIRLLQAVCTVAMLGAVPAFAQSNTRADSAPPAGQQAMPANTNTAGSDSKTSMAPAGKDGLGMPGHGQTMHHTMHHSMHRSAMTHRDRAMHGSKTDASQDPTVDQLNNQSYQAAQKGQAFTGSGSDTSHESGDMNKMSGHGMSGHGMSGHGMSGHGMSDSNMSGHGMSGTDAASHTTSGGDMSGSGASTK